MHQGHDLEMKKKLFLMKLPVKVRSAAYQNRIFAVTLTLTQQTIAKNSRSLFIVDVDAVMDLGTITLRTLTDNNAVHPAADWL